MIRNDAFDIDLISITHKGLTSRSCRLLIAITPPEKLVRKSQTNGLQTSEWRQLIRNDALDKDLILITQKGLTSRSWRLLMEIPLLEKLERQSQTNGLQTIEWRQLIRNDAMDIDLILITQKGLTSRSCRLLLAIPPLEKLVRKSQTNGLQTSEWR